MMPGPAATAPSVSRSLSDLDPILRERFLALTELWNARFRFRKLIVTCTYRSPEEQARLYRQGRTEPGRIVTWIDGVSQKGRHNVWPAEAVDVAVVLWTAEPTVIKPAVTWNRAFYKPLLPLAEKVGLVSGGGWSEKKRDWPHLELPWEVA